MAGPDVPEAAEPPDLPRLLELADQVLDLTLTRLPEATPEIRDWNDHLLAEAVGRGYRCLRSIRTLAAAGEGEDAAVLTRALVALTLRYLWLAAPNDTAEREDRFRRLIRLWARERATVIEELNDLDVLEDDTAAQAFRAKADELRVEGVRRVPHDDVIARRLDHDVQPEPPRFFELVYALIYRTTSEVAHYGLGTALAGYMEGRIPTPHARGRSTG